MPAQKSDGVVVVNGLGTKVAGVVLAGAIGWAAWVTMGIGDLRVNVASIDTKLGMVVEHLDIHSP